jgi:crossover junction endodeoxyribonuclease RusA
MSFLTFTVLGDPQPQGSMRAFIPKGWSRAVLTSSNKKMKPWRQEVAGTALAEMEKAGLECSDNGVPFRLALVFRFKRPKSVRKTVLYKTTHPDTDKLIRAILDALTGIVWHDDAQVVEIRAKKEFGEHSGAQITFWELDNLPPGRALEHQAIKDDELAF